MISLKSCLTISFVSSSQALMSSALIPLLPADLPVLSLLIALCRLFCRNFITHFMFGVISFTVLVESFVEFSKSIGNSFSRCDAFSFLVLYFCDEYSLLCCFDSRNISDTFELFKDSFNVSLSLHSFFSLMHFFYAFAQVLQSLFSLLWACFSLSSMSLRISASLIEAFFILFCCCRRGHLYFFVVVLEHARASAGMEHGRTCLFDLMRNLCTKMFF